MEKEKDQWILSLYDVKELVFEQINKTQQYDSKDRLIRCLGLCCHLHSHFSLLLDFRLKNAIKTFHSLN